MAINLAGQQVQDVRVAGVQAQRVMLGTGTTAVEVWSADIRSGAQIWMPLDPPGRPLLEHAGTLTPAVTSTTLQARYGYGYTPAGAGPGVMMHYAGTWDTGGTVSMWVRQTGQTTGAHAAFYRKSGTTEVAMWQQVGASPPYMLFSLIMNGTVVDLHATNVTVPNNQWVMVTITVSRPAGSSSWTVRGYVNGQPAGSVTRSAAAQPIAPGDIVLAGTSWGGDLDDLLVWDRALTPAEVAQVSSAGPPLPVVTITGTSVYQSRDQFRAACTQYGVDYQTVQRLPFLLDTSQATDLYEMFRDCSSLTTVPDLDTSQATNLSNMFRNCSSLTTVPDLDTSQATNLSYMFYNCSALTTVPDLDTSQATSLGYMFYNCSSLTDGNVRCIGRHPNAYTFSMILSSGLTRLPFYDTNGNPI